uniref:Uncharacterized protein n=1 Tax=Panthera leo TaxID=9689 RepID=A0A8C8Y959_PANLE
LEAEFREVSLGCSQPVTCICEEGHTENEIKSRDPIRCRECEYRIMYQKGLKDWWVLIARAHMRRGGAERETDRQTESEAGSGL